MQNLRMSVLQLGIHADAVTLFLQVSTIL